MGHVLINNTHGKDDVERAALSFVVGNTALNSGQQATVLLTIEGVWVATTGYADGLEAKGFAPLNELLQQFIDNGGQVWACGACCKPRGITEADMRPGAKIVGAANVVEALLTSGSAITF